PRDNAIDEIHTGIITNHPGIRNGVLEEPHLRMALFEERRHSWIDFDRHQARVRRNLSPDVIRYNPGPRPVLQNGPRISEIETGQHRSREILRAWHNSSDNSRRCEKFPQKMHGGILTENATRGLRMKDRRRVCATEAAVQTAATEKPELLFPHLCPIAWLEIPLWCYFHVRTIA